MAWPTTSLKSHSYEDAKTKIRNFKPEIIVTDFHLLDADATLLLKEISYPASVIILTGTSNTEEIRKNKDRYRTF